jgi:integrase
LYWGGIREGLLKCDTFEKLLQALQAYARSITGKQMQSKVMRPTHHAQNSVSFALRVCRTEGIAQFFPHGFQVPGPRKLSIKAVLRGVQSRSIAGDPLKRRRFNDDEVALMMSDVANDPIRTVLLVILREFAFRATALGRVTYNTLFESPSHNPQTHLKILEKNNHVRCVLVSDNLKSKLIIMKELLRKAHAQSKEPEETIWSWFVFNPTDPKQPLSRTSIYSIMKALAKRQNITDVVVHPHAWRHTLVCGLADAGNPMDLIDKFMDHRSVSTTRDSYLTYSTDELFDRLQLPGSTTVDKASERELEDQRVKSCLLMIDVYKKALQSDCSCSEALYTLNQRFPFLHEMESAIRSSSVSK